MPDSAAGDEFAERNRDEVAAILQHGELNVEGRLLEASNATFYATASLDGVHVPCVYKPVRGEKPLWDFPDGTLADREVATHLVSELTGWHIVPPTVLTHGPFGDGMAQQWVDVVDDTAMVDLVDRDETPDGWRHVLDAYDHRDRPVALVHADTPALRRIVLLDAVVNNTDRKGGHILVMADGHVHGCDHGVTFHVEDKLRTILWGWAGEPLDDEAVEVLERLRTDLAERSAAGLREHLTGAEVGGARRRVDRLLRDRTYPRPSPGWHAIPWPAW